MQRLGGRGRPGFNVHYFIIQTVNSEIINTLHCTQLTASTALHYSDYNYRILKGKRYVPEKEYIHMILSYITADWSNIE